MDPMLKTLVSILLGIVLTQYAFTLCNEFHIVTI